MDNHFDWASGDCPYGKERTLKQQRQAQGQQGQQQQPTTGGGLGGTGRRGAGVGVRGKILDEPFGWAVNNHMGALKKIPVPMSTGGHNERGRYGGGGGDPYNTEFGCYHGDLPVGQEWQRQRHPMQQQRGSSGGDTGQAKEAMGTGRNGRRWTIFCSSSELGSIFGNDVGGKDTPVCLY